MSSPHCSTVCRARHRPLKSERGPRPLRSRQDVWWPLQYCNDREVAGCLLGSLLALRCFTLFFVAGRRGAVCMHEHPRDPMSEPYPSFFNTNVVRWITRVLNCVHVSIDQCMYGALYQKPTTILCNAVSLSSLRANCTHSKHSVTLVGRGPDGCFRSTPAALYPERLSRALGEGAVAELEARSWHLVQRDDLPASGPWESGLPPAISAAWRHAGAVSGGDRRLQQ